MRQVLALAGQRGCLVRALLAHFGEELRRDCGHCGSCLGEPRGSAGLERQTAIPNVERAQIASLVRNFPKALGTARQIARFLPPLRYKFAPPDSEQLSKTLSSAVWLKFRLAP